MNPGEEYLSKRFQQIMEAIYQKGQATASEIEESLPGSPSNATVRTQLRVLEERGLVKHRVERGKFIYEAVQPKPNAAVAAMRRFLQTFVDGSLEQGLATLLTAKETELGPEDLARLRRIIDEAEGKGESK
jgi:predicted transcriptional regulator